jgi:hypothetical protein
MSLPTSSLARVCNASTMSGDSAFFKSLAVMSSLGRSISTQAAQCPPMPEKPKADKAKRAEHPTFCEDVRAIFTGGSAPSLPLRAHT